MIIRKGSIICAVIGKKKPWLCLFGSTKKVGGISALRSRSICSLTARSAVMDRTSWEFSLNSMLCFSSLILFSTSSILSFIGSVYGKCAREFPISTLCEERYG